MPADLLVVCYLAELSAGSSAVLMALNILVSLREKSHGGDTIFIMQKLCICGVRQDFLDFSTEHRVVCGGRQISVI